MIRKTKSEADHRIACPCCHGEGGWERDSWSVRTEHTTRFVRCSACEGTGAVSRERAHELAMDLAGVA